MKKSIGVVLLLCVLLVGAVWVSKNRLENDPMVLSTKGIHWHPELLIYVKGVEQDIPKNIGIGPEFSGVPGYNSLMRMSALHTHEDLPVLHLEFPGVVRTKDITLGAFFNVWRKDIRSLGTNLRMKVNGVPSTEYEMYVMKDGDKIELHYDE